MKILHLIFLLLLTKNLNAQSFLKLSKAIKKSYSSNFGYSSVKEFGKVEYNLRSKLYDEHKNLCEQISSDTLFLINEIIYSEAVYFSSFFFSDSSFVFYTSDGGKDLIIKKSQKYNQKFIECIKKWDTTFILKEFDIKSWKVEPPRTIVIYRITKGKKKYKVDLLSIKGNPSMYQ